MYIHAHTHTQMTRSGTTDDVNAGMMMRKNVLNHVVFEKGIAEHGEKKGELKDMVTDLPYGSKFRQWHVGG